MKHVLLSAIALNHWEFHILSCLNGAKVHKPLAGLKRKVWSPIFFWKYGALSLSFSPALPICQCHQLKINQSQAKLWYLLLRITTLVSCWLCSTNRLCKAKYIFTSDVNTVKVTYKHNVNITNSLSDNLFGLCILKRFHEHYILHCFAWPLWSASHRNQTWHKLLCFIGQNYAKTSFIYPDRNVSNEVRGQFLLSSRDGHLKRFGKKGLWSFRW